MMICIDIFLSDLSSVCCGYTRLVTRKHISYYHISLFNDNQSVSLAMSKSIVNRDVKFTHFFNVDSLIDTGSSGNLHEKNRHKTSTI